MKSIIALLLTFLGASSAAAGLDDFVGDWEVTELVAGQEPDPSGTEIKYPKQLRFELTDGRLVARYTDQAGHACATPGVLAVNDGHDVLFVVCGTTKSPQSYAPIHHIKAKDGELHAVVTTTERRFGWTARRVGQ